MEIEDLKAMFWIRLDTLPIAGPFKNEDEADDYITVNTSKDGLIEIEDEGYIGLVLPSDLHVIYDPAYSLEIAIEDYIEKAESEV